MTEPHQKKIIHLNLLIFFACNVIFKAFPQPIRRIPYFAQDPTRATGGFFHPMPIY